MAINQSDPINQLADNIIDSMAQIASSKAVTASYDKTFVVTILGVNQDFTGDVTQAEQREIIAKYSIPETVTDGDQSYYTFKLDGIYYTRRQNGNFMLYDTALLRVPNNNWDSMFLEQISNNDVDSIHIRNIYVDSLEPPVAGKDYDPSPINVLSYSFWFYFSPDNKGVYQYNSIYELALDTDTSETIYKKLNIVVSEDTPEIDSKYVSEQDGNYYWVKVNQDNALTGIYKTTKTTNGSTYRYIWDMENPVMHADQGGLIYPPTEYSGLPKRDTVPVPNSNGKANYYCYLSPFPPMVKNDIWIEVSDLSSKTCVRLKEFSTTGEWIEMADIPLNGIVVSTSDAGDYIDGHTWIQHLAMRDSDGMSQGNSFTTNDTRAWNYNLSLNEWDEKIVCSMGDFPMREGSYYIEYNDDNDIAIIYRCKEDKEEWDRENLDQIYPTTDPNDIPPIVVNVPPNVDGTLWAKVNSLVSKKIISISQYLNGKWVLKYEVDGCIQNMISYPEQPTIPDNISKNDCYVAVDVTYDAEMKPTVTFKALYTYSTAWDKVEAGCGGSLPATANVGDYYIVANDLFSSVAVYICSEITDEGEAVWEPAPANETYVLPYPPVREGDFWIKTDNVQSKRLLAIYQRINGDWIHICNSSSGVGEFLDPQHTTERFNDYRPYQYDEAKQKWVGGNYSDMLYDHIEGYDNKSTHIGGPDYTYRWAGYNHIEGYGNEIVNDYAGYNHVEGRINKLNKDHSCYVGGQENTVYDSVCTTVHGQNNTVLNAYFCTIFGEHNYVGDNTQYPHVGVSTSYNAVFGEGIAVYSNYCVAIGHGYTVRPFSDYYLTVGAAIYGISFSVTGAGIVDAYRYDGGGADYAEYFEWADGNPDNEDRCGMLVTLDGDRIVPADGDDIFGIVSAAPVVMGNSYEKHWHNKYVTDVYGRRILDQNGTPIISDKFDESKEYIARSNRPEWDAVGMVGRLVIQDDGSCEPNRYVAARNGVGSNSEHKTNVRVLKRIDDNHVEVLIK